MCPITRLEVHATRETEIHITSCWAVNKSLIIRWSDQSHMACVNV
jgi:hypothetical protein